MDILDKLKIPLNSPVCMYLIKVYIDGELTVSKLLWILKSGDKQEKIMRALTLQYPNRHDYTWLFFANPLLNRSQLARHDFRFLVGNYTYMITLSGYCVASFGIFFMGWLLYIDCLWACYIWLLFSYIRLLILGSQSTPRIVYWAACVGFSIEIAAFGSLKFWDICLLIAADLVQSAACVGFRFLAWGRGVCYVLGCFRTIWMKMSCIRAISQLMLPRSRPDEV